MSQATPAAAGTPLKEFVQELRTNRKTQGMAVAFLAVLAWMVWMFWPEQKKAPHRSAAAASSPSLALDPADPQLIALRKLPDLAKLDRAGELPKEPEMARDLFLFDSPQRSPEVYEVFVPPPPPPTPEEVEAKRLADSRKTEESTRPGGLRYLGYMVTAKRGPFGAFMKGEEPVTLSLGDLSFRGWKLVKLDDTGAEFQNLKFPDLHHKLQPSDGGGPKVDAVRNEF
jgi:hypothetical protein